ncbi:serine/threonine protein phosphatase PrpC [Bradyrhizobium japonicum]
MATYDIGLFTHRGVVRPRNEDAIFADGAIFQGNQRDVIAMRLTEAPHAVLVADGIGGQPEGDLASRTALQFLTSDVGLLQTPAGCEAALHAANERLYEVMEEPGRIGMGTTVAGLILQDAAVITFNVGDSRAYRLGRGGLAKLSHEDVLASGREESPSDRSHAITQALGGSAFPLAIAPHVSVGPPMHIGDRFLLCTDGLTDALDDSDLESLLHLSASPVTIARKLVRQAILAGSRDNISVVVGMCS